MCKERFDRERDREKEGVVKLKRYMQSHQLTMNCYKGLKRCCSEGVSREEKKRSFFSICKMKRKAEEPALCRRLERNGISDCLSFLLSCCFLVFFQIYICCRTLCFVFFFFYRQLKHSDSFPAADKMPDLKRTLSGISQH